MRDLLIPSGTVLLLLAMCVPFEVSAQRESTGELSEEHAGPAGGGGAEASNPLAGVNNIDLKWTHSRLTDADRSRSNLFWIKGGHTFTRWAKLSYELVYEETDITGSSEHDWNSLSLKPIFFIKSGELGTWKYRLATGFELILDFDNREKGIGTGSDQISPLLGVALMPRRGTTLVPLVQHFLSLNGDDINVTGLRFIGIQQFPKDSWGKLDLIVPHDWNNHRTPTTMEVELGRMLTPRFGVYVSGLTGLGGDRNLKWGGSFNFRFAY